MSSSRVLFEVVLRILIEIIEFRVRIERISYHRHFESIPNLIKERVGGHTNGICIGHLESYFTIVSYRIYLVNSVDCLLRVTDCAGYLLDFVKMEQITLVIVF